MCVVLCYGNDVIYGDYDTVDMFLSRKMFFLRRIDSLFLCFPLIRSACACVSRILVKLNDTLCACIVG